MLSSIIFSDKIFTGSGLEEERKFPLLEEVFKNFPTIPINIDIKVDNEKLIKEVSRLIKVHHREHLTVWGNFDNNITVKCYKEVCWKYLGKWDIADIKAYLCFRTQMLIFYFP